MGKEIKDGIPKDGIPAAHYALACRENLRHNSKAYTYGSSVMCVLTPVISRVRRMGQLWLTALSHQEYSAQGWLWAPRSVCGIISPQG
ncbi:hypothetical protein [Sodalis sp.]|uniref:hypothetical protein n=1 Tax=Sodalis sp. (in: enterobacteria) TaxID=1898979 RepID=UPI0038738CB3